jgi:hypothetical protein
LGTEQENTGGIRLCRVPEAGPLVATIRRGDTDLVYVTTDLGGATDYGGDWLYEPQAPYVPFTLELQTTPTEVKDIDGWSLRVKAIEITVQLMTDLLRISEYASFTTEGTRRAELAKYAKKADAAKNTQAIDRILSQSRAVAEEGDDDSGDWDDEGDGQTVPSSSIDAQARFEEHDFTLAIHQKLHLFYRPDMASSTTKFNNQGTLGLKISQLASADGLADVFRHHASDWYRPDLAHPDVPPGLPTAVYAYILSAMRYFGILVEDEKLQLEGLPTDTYTGNRVSAHIKDKWGVLPRTPVIHTLQALCPEHRKAVGNALANTPKENRISEQVWQSVQKHVRAGGNFGGHKQAVPTIANEDGLLVEFRNIGYPPPEFKHAFYSPA